MNIRTGHRTSSNVGCNIAVDPRSTPLGVPVLGGWPGGGGESGKNETIREDVGIVAAGNNPVVTLG